MSSGRPKLDEKQEAAIAGLLTEKTHELAAKQAGIATSTLARWLREPAFKSAYREARRAIVDSAIGRLQASASKAVDALEKNLTCGRPSDENRAATAILEFSFKAVEVADLGERVDELEQLLGEIRDGKPVECEGGETPGSSPDDSGDSGTELDPARPGEVSLYPREVYAGGAETGPVGEATGGGDPPPGTALPGGTEVVP